ncbi:4-aminobutyrate--2-oxoglutarate transaminase [Temperatibacter marinus]|uniref:4-aminobutyrate--2-oxoglutarate transaminase n=1 Tax=Temperatibacter marinus TaxID=1456591 RepID=A0AA52EGZ5_9PROT|nr:4-aminobutyrate--2-oxoglutarate transaminase [Temperatibacter marinus]WND02973.1 4-aminobutyrate--2-oxoglutarate transaminase [Temperatibacter marinus]
MTKNNDLRLRRLAAVAPGVASATSVFASKALNAEVWDADGQRYLDFAMGIAVCNTGHCHPKIIQAAKDQCDLYTHTAFQVSPYEPYVKLCERLNALAPIREAKSVLFSTGAEAVENAIKIARVHTKRPGVIAFRGAFHGRTALTSTLTGKIVPYRASAGTGASNVFHAPFPIPHHGISVKDALNGVKALFKSDIEAHDVAAIILEPVQGEGGFYQAPKEFMQALREICDEHGILLICDEVQTGFGRTGKMFATEHYETEPDIMTVAKAMGGGFPISGVIAKSYVLDSTLPGGLGGTYGGNPVACAASLATIEAIEEEGLIKRSQAIGDVMVDRLNAFKANKCLPAIGDVRGIGAMVAFEMVKEKGGHEPDSEVTTKLVTKAHEKGLILLSCGYFGNTIRLLAPLTIPDHHLHEGLDLLEEALKAC